MVYPLAGADGQYFFVQINVHGTVDTYQIPYKHSAYMNPPLYAPYLYHISR